MTAPASGNPWVRRARPLLGTLVEVGVPAETRDAGLAEHAFTAIAAAQACLSRFDDRSDVTHFGAIRAGESMRVRAPMVAVLTAARELQLASDGVFDITLGSGLGGWCLVDSELHKLRDGARFDLGGIAKGHAVDCAIEALIERGCPAGWVNAGGDLRAFGAVEVPVALRDEARGGVRPFATLGDGAFATSRFDVATRSRAFDARPGAVVRAWVSVTAPLCLWADALTKLVAIAHDASHPLLTRYGAQAWLH